MVPLLVEAMLIALFALLSIHSEKHWRFQHQELEATLCFAMGLQNAMVTRLSGAVVRTTHLTGITTDLGIKLVRIFYMVSDRMRGRAVAVVPDMKRFKLLIDNLVVILERRDGGARALPAHRQQGDALARLRAAVARGLLTGCWVWARCSPRRARC